ncbi:hypothetical protein BDB01DRAFT_839462 [Pilobolus umbonatus]|nr:hypothetical protein BDB01DRAFT_839462 [Pilobolus umbonatus]
MFIHIPLLLLALSNIIHAYCIHNKLEDGTSITVLQDEYRIRKSMRFRKTIDAGTYECCHYSNRDCSPKQTKDMAVFFIIQINSDEPTEFIAQCYSGGGLNIYGSQGIYKAICLSSTGYKYEVELMKS